MPSAETLCRSCGQVLPVSSDGEDCWIQCDAVTGGGVSVMSTTTPCRFFLNLPQSDTHDLHEPVVICGCSRHKRGICVLHGCESIKCRPLLGRTGNAACCLRGRRAVCMKIGSCTTEATRLFLHVHKAAWQSRRDRGAQPATHI